ncbi:MAG: hypothetical protein ABIO60_12335 [Aquaticitalea sp.]
MKTNHFKLLTALLLLIFCFNCAKEPLDKEPSNTINNDGILLNKKIHSNTFYGPNVKLGNGKIRSWIRINSDNVPEEIGVEMTSGAMENLPSNEAGLSIVLPLHHKAQEVTPYDHIYVNWNPHGHEPQGVFSVPHFDIHFVMTSVAEREMIPAWAPGSIDAMFNNYPPQGFMPSNYGTPPGPFTAEIAMGKHWAPMNLVAFLPFTKIMIYGSYDGEVVFLEPMITLAYLRSPEAFTIPFSQPEYFQLSTYYPTEYNSYFDSHNGNRMISLGGFVYRDAAN